jgi:hypothetical protein
MKKTILLLTFVTLTLFSCSSSDDSASIDTTQLVATWLLDNAKLNGEDVDSSYKIQFTTAERAKFYYLNPTSNTTFGPDTIENGDYLLNGNTINISWDESGSTQYQILELTTTKLKIKSIIPGEGTLIETYIK